MSIYRYRKTYQLKGRWSVEFILNECLYISMYEFHVFHGLNVTFVDY